MSRDIVDFVVDTELVDSLVTGREVEYCDVHVCLFVCLSVCPVTVVFLLTVIARKFVYRLIIDTIYRKILLHFVEIIEH